MHKSIHNHVIRKCETKPKNKLVISYTKDMQFIKTSIWKSVIYTKISPKHDCLPMASSTIHAINHEQYSAPLGIIVTCELYLLQFDQSPTTAPECTVTLYVSVYLLFALESYPSEWGLMVQHTWRTLSTIVIRRYDITCD